MGNFFKILYWYELLNGIVFKIDNMLKIERGYMYYKLLLIDFLYKVCINMFINVYCIYFKY